MQYPRDVRGVPGLAVLRADCATRCKYGRTCVLQVGFGVEDGESGESGEPTPCGVPEKLSLAERPWRVCACGVASLAESSASVAAESDRQNLGNPAAHE
eukprot:9355505-Pyramimonas_sp.AAC.1